MIVNADPAEVTEFLARHPATATVECLVADLNGILRGKRVAGNGLAKLYGDGICLPGSVFALDITGATVEATGLGLAQGDADRICRPVAGTLRTVPWVRDGSLAQVLVTMEDGDGRPFFADPRNVLRHVLAKFDALGFTPDVAVELEFYLVDTERDASGAPQPPISPYDGRRETHTQVYSIEDLATYSAFLGAVAQSAAAQGIPADTAVAEYAPGQFEINLDHRADALRACDDAICLKRIVRAEAKRHGMEATFMARPYADQPGNGLHVHLSLRDSAGSNAFASDEPGGNALLRHAVGGMRELMAQSMAFFAPNANSLRRFRPGSYAPTSAGWGINNRTTALRIPAGPAHARRIEHRVAGADANPYLVMACVLGAAAVGIDRQLDPGPPTTGNAYAGTATLPTAWPDTLAALANSTALDELLGADFTRVYRAVKSAERDLFDREITPLEFRWYLGVV